MAETMFKPIRFSGDIKIGRWTSDTVFGGFDNPINFKDLSINPEGEVIRQPDNGITYFGQNKSMHFQPKPTKVAFEVDEADANLLADLLRGFSSTFSQSAASDGSATVTLVKDRWVDLGAMNVGSVVIGTKVGGTDYKVDAILGQVMALTDGTAGSQTVTFHKGAIAGNKIVSGNTGIILLGLSGQVKNHNSGETGVLRIPKIAIDPKSALQIIGGKGDQGFKFDAETVVVEGQPIFTFYPNLAFTDPA